MLLRGRAGSRRASLVFALGWLSFGCGTTSGPARPSPVVAATPPPVTTTRAEGPAPEVKAEILSTRDDLVRVPRPQGEGWECHIEHSGAAMAGVRVSYVQCLKKSEQGTASLMAKDYEVPRAFVMSAQELSTVEYPKHYRKRWDKVTYTRQGPVDHRGVPGYEATIELSRQTGLRVRLVERVIVVGTHTLNLSGEAPPEMFAAFEPEMKRWFDGADFAVLRVDPRQLAEQGREEENESAYFFGSAAQRTPKNPHR